MAWTKHPRELTDEQFSNGGTIDGNRIDTALEESLEGYNLIKPRHVMTRFVPSTYVLGWSPQRPESADPTTLAGYSEAKASFPWMAYRNTSAAVKSTSSQPAEFENEFRMKGNFPPQFYKTDIVGPSADDELLFIMTSSHYFTRPCIVDSVYLGMFQDNPSLAAQEWALDPLVAGSGYDYGAGDKPGNLLPDARDKSLCLSVDLDDQFSQEDRSRNSVLVLKRNFELDRETLTQIQWSQTTAGQPLGKDLPTVNYPGGSPHGVRIHLKDLNIPVPAASRLRFRVSIPYAPATGVDKAKPYDFAWGDWPWFMQYYTGSMVVKEELVWAK